MSWYVRQDDKQYGPISDALLKQWALEGTITPLTQVLKEGRTQWVEASRIRGLFPERLAPAEIPMPEPAASQPSPPPLRSRGGKQQPTIKYEDDTLNLVFGIAGVAILVIGVFTPFLKLPIVGDVNYFQNGKGDGVIVLVLAGMSFAVALLKHFKWLLVTGMLTLGCLAFAFFNVQRRLAEVKQQMAKDLEGNPFHGLAEGMMASIQLQWGFAVLVVGAIILIAAALIPKRQHIVRN